MPIELVNSRRGATMKGDVRFMFNISMRPHTLCRRRKMSVKSMMNKITGAMTRHIQIIIHPGPVLVMAQENL